MYLIIDVDGVITDGKMIYSKEGKEYKTFGPDDTDALNWLKENHPNLNIFFVSADKRGFEISKKRIDDMGFELKYMPAKHRWQHMQQEGYNLYEIIYIGDGWYDGETFDNVSYSICPNNGFYKTKEKATFVTESNGGERCLAEACIVVCKMLDRWPNEHQ